MNLFYQKQLHLFRTLIAVVTVVVLTLVARDAACQTNFGGIARSYPTFSNADPLGFQALSTALATAVSATNSTTYILSQLPGLTNYTDAAVLAATQAAIIRENAISNALAAADSAYALQFAGMSNSLANAIALESFKADAISNALAQVDAETRVYVNSVSNALTQADANLLFLLDTATNALAVADANALAAALARETVISNTFTYADSAIGVRINSLSNLLALADIADRAYAFSLFNSVAGTNAFYKLFDLNNPTNSWLEWSSNVLEVVSVNAGVTSRTDYASFTNALWAAINTKVSTNDAAYLNTVTKAGTAWQNPASATNWTWTSNGKEITLTGYNFSSLDVVIPDMLDGLPVISVGTIFKNTNITSVSGGANVASIALDAFYNCASLLSVELKSLKTIGGGAFWGAFTGCSALTNVVIPSAVAINDSAFENCTSLKTISILNATSVQAKAFSGCTFLTSVFLGENAPTQKSQVYGGSATSVTNYVTNPTATGWGATWNGRPVVRMPVASDLYTGNGAGLTNVNASTLAGYDIDAIMAVGSTYFFNTNFISYGVVTGREASLTVPSTGGYLTYAGPVTNGQYLNSYLIPANQMPALISKGTKATFEFYGGHAGTPSQNPTLMGDFYIMNTNGTVVQEFESPVMVIPRGEDYFKLEITFTNDVIKDGYAFLLKTRIIDRDGYTGDFISYFGKPYYTGFSFPKATGVFTPEYVYNAHTALSLKDGAHDGSNVVTNNQTGVTLNTMAINNGFREQYEQNLTFDSATRVMTVTPTNGVFKVTAGGITHSFTSAVSSSAAPLSDDLYFYFNTAGQFIGTNTAWGINGEAQVGYVKLFTNDSSVVFTIDERHGVNISDEWHRQQHFTVGTKWSSGLSLFHNASDTSTASLASGIGTCISIADGIIYDEDVKHQTVTNGVQSNAGIATNTAGVFPILYRNANQQWIRTAGTAFPFLWSGNIPQISSNGVVSNVTEDRYFVYWIVTLGGFRGTNCFLIPHPVTYTSTALAQSGASPYSLGSVLGDLPSTEMLVSHRLIFQYNASNPNANAIEVKYSKLRDVTDFRALSSGVIVAGTQGATSQIVHNDTFGRDVASTHPASSIDVTFTPTNYTASAANVEAHLGGIDSKLTGVVTNGQTDDFTLNAQIGIGGAPAGSLWMMTITGEYGWTSKNYNGVATFEMYNDAKEMRLLNSVDLISYSGNADVVKYRLYGATGNALFNGTVTASNLTVSGISRIILPTSTNGLASGTLWNNGGNISQQGITSPLTFTNSTTLSDGALGGTNGVYFTRNGTNYWLLLP